MFQASSFISACVVVADMQVFVYCEHQCFSALCQLWFLELLFSLVLVLGNVNFFQLFFSHTKPFNVVQMWCRVLSLI